MLRTCGLKTISNPIDEAYICVPDATMHPARAWNEPELLSATGQLWQDQVGIKVQK